MRSHDADPDRHLQIIDTLLIGVERWPPVRLMAGAVS